METSLTISQYLNQDNVLQSIKQTLNDKAPQFIASVSSLVSSNKALQSCDRRSLMSACLIAASLDLPINQSLGFAYIIPYKNNKTGVTEAQFQAGWKAYVQLAQRSGQYRLINVTDVRNGEIAGQDRLSGEIKFKWNEDELEREKEAIVGYVAYFELLNGFRKMHYMTVAELNKHAKRYSQAFRNNRQTQWVDDFDAMAKKTVLKLLISKFGVMTVDMQKAVVDDQSVAREDGTLYIDNQPTDPEEVAFEKEKERIRLHIENAKTEKELHEVVDLVGEYELSEQFDAKYLEVQGEQK